MRFVRLLLLAALAYCGALALSGCKASLQSGGAYAPAGQAPDLAFYVADAAYQVAYQTVDAAFTFEHNNRAFLWGVSPNIKKTLDGIRPDAVKANGDYLHARAVYLANPTPAGLSGVQAILVKIQQLATTAASVLPR